MPGTSGSSTSVAKPNQIGTDGSVDFSAESNIARRNRRADSMPEVTTASILTTDTSTSTSTATVTALVSSPDDSQSMNVDPAIASLQANSTVKATENVGTDDVTPQENLSEFSEHEIQNTQSNSVRTSSQSVISGKVDSVGVIQSELASEIEQNAPVIKTEDSSWDPSLSSNVLNASIQNMNDIESVLNPQTVDQPVPLSLPRSQDSPRSIPIIRTIVYDEDVSMTFVRFPKPLVANHHELIKREGDAFSDAIPFINTVSLHRIINICKIALLLDDLVSTYFLFLI